MVHGKESRNMAEQFLTLMADLDQDSQGIMSGWYDSLQEAGFTGAIPELRCFR